MATTSLYFSTISPAKTNLRANLARQKGNALETIFNAIFFLIDALLPFSFLEPEFMKRALLAMLLVAPATAAIGVPLVQFRMAFFSDAIGHSAFTGVALGILLGVSPTWTMVVFGALVAVGIVLVKGRTDLSADTVIGVFFSTAIALGIAIISRAKGLTRNLQMFLYGDPLAISDAEIVWLLFLLLLVGFFLIVTYNRLLLLGIHEGFARSKGVRVKAVEVSFALITSLVVTAAIRTVGILLVTALLIIPAAAARNIARAAAPAFLLSIGISLFSGVCGLIASYYLDTATGATIVLASSACFILTAAMRTARSNE